MLQACGDDEDFQDIEKKRIADEMTIIIDQYRERGLSGGKQVLRLWPSEHPTILPPTVKHVSNRNAYMARDNLKKNGIVNLQDINFTESCYVLPINIFPPIRLLNCLILVVTFRPSGITVSY